MHKSFRNGATIRESSPKAMQQVRRLGWVANTLKPSEITSWKPSFSVFSSVMPGRQTSLQAWIAQKMEDSWRLSYIAARTGYHKEGASEWYAAEIWGWRRQKVWGRWHLRQRGLCQGVNNRSAARALLSSLVERLPWGGKYLGACIGNSAPSKACYRILQRQFKEANSDLPSRQYGSTNGYAYDGLDKKMWPTFWVHYHHQASKEVLDLSPAQFPLSFPLKKVSYL